MPFFSTSSPTPPAALPSTVGPGPGLSKPWFARPDNQLLLLVLLAAFPLYYELGRNPVQLWDESRLAVNAAEMVRDGHWLVPHFDGKPDHWNTKPPLLIWLEALSFQAFGFSTWALRLPTLLASLATVGLLFRFAARQLARPLAGLFAVIVLVTSAGYLSLHVARTGDYDALLTCWQVLLWTQFFEYLETGRRRQLGWVAVAVLAGTLTKGPAGLLGLPGLLAYAVGRGKLGWLLRQRGIYVVAVGWLAVMSGYFLLRETVDPGYWQAVQANDLGGRYLTVIEGHSAPWMYYLHNMVNERLTGWLWAIGPALLLVALQPAGRVRRAAGMLAAFVVGWLVVISTAQSKLTWYDAPIYPALALLLGLGLSMLYQHLLGLYLLGRGWWTGWLIKVSLFGLLFYPGYRTIVRQLADERHSNFNAGYDGYLGRYLTLLQRQQPQVNDVAVFTAGQYYDALQYYKLQFEHTPGNRLNIWPGSGARKLAAGRIVVLCDPAYRVALDSTFRVIELHQDYPCQTVLLAPK